MNPSDNNTDPSSQQDENQPPVIYQPTTASPQPKEPEPVTGEDRLAQQSAEPPIVEPSQQQAPAQPFTPQVFLPPQHPETPTDSQQIITGGAVSSTAPVSDTAVKSFKTKKIIMAVVLAVVVIGGGATGFALWQNSRSNPASVLKAALYKSLSQTKVIIQQTSLNSSAKILLDASNPKMPKSDTKLDLNVFGININLEGYGNTKSGYVRYSDNHSLTSQEKLIANKWVLVEQNGKFVSGLDPTSQSLVDPLQMELGDWLVGNFSASQQSSLVNYALANNVYSYHAKDVNKSTLDGKSVYVYDVTLNSKKLVNYNQMAGRLLGESKAEIDSLTSGLSGTSNATIYLDIRSKQIVKLVSNPGGVSSGNITNTYSFNSNFQMPKQPQAQLPYSQLEAGINSLSSGGVSGNPSIP